MPRNLVKIIPTKNTFDIYKTPEISCFTKLSIYPLTTPSGPPTMTNLPCYDNCTLFITLYIPDKNTIDYLLLLFVSPICKLPAKIQLVNGKHEVLRTLFFWPGSTTRIRKTLVREEVTRSALETTDPKSRRPTRKKKWKILKEKVSVFTDFFTVIAAFKNMETVQYLILFWKFFGKKTGLLYWVIPSTILSFLQSVIFTWIRLCSRGSPTSLLYIFIQFDLIKYLVEVSVCTSACRKNINKQTTNS
jgi:hypothetical protein